MEFKQLALAINARYKEMEKDHTLYTVAITKDVLWKAYMDSFPEGTNPIAYEQRVYDCNECKKFVRSIGGVVAIIDGKVESVWNVNVDGYYDDVVKFMDGFVTNAPIENKFFIAPNLLNNKMIGSVKNKVLPESETLYREKIGKTFHHFNALIDSSLIKQDVATIKSKIRSKFDVYKRSCEELTLDAVATVKDLINSDLYRGQEHLQGLLEFEELLEGYHEALDKEVYLWNTLDGRNRKIRSTVIGTLLQDVTTETLEVAVGKFEDKVSAGKYKRTNAVVTPAMKDTAMKLITEKGIEESLYKRYAELSDVSVNDVLFVDNKVSDKMADGIAGLMNKGVITQLSIGKVRDTITLDHFIETILPKTESMSVLFENNQVGNLVSLIAPQYETSPNIQQWDNNFSWAYKGGAADSMKEKVKSAGGRVDGVLRFSIQWNEERMEPYNDLDAHCQCPEGHIDYSQKKGRLDVDIQRPNTETAVENITWLNHSDIADGAYRFYVNNYSGPNYKGFRAEIELDGEVHQFDYPQSVTRDVVVATVIYKGGQFTIETDMESSVHSKEIWGIKTKELVKVDSVMYSPNFWGDNKVGNQHTFFMLEGCKNPNSIRGLYNEHLRGDLQPVRKSIDMLAPMLMCKQTDKQISGIGFNNYHKDDITVVVRGDGVSGTYVLTKEF